METTWAPRKLYRILSARILSLITNKTVARSPQRTATIICLLIGSARQLSSSCNHQKSQSSQNASHKILSTMSRFRIRLQARKYLLKSSSEAQSTLWSVSIIWTTLSRPSLALKKVLMSPISQLWASKSQPRATKDTTAWSDLRARMKSERPCQECQLRTQCEAKLKQWWCRHPLPHSTVRPQISNHWQLYSWNRTTRQAKAVYHRCQTKRRHQEEWTISRQWFNLKVRLWMTWSLAINVAEAQGQRMLSKRSWLWVCARKAYQKLRKALKTWKQNLDSVRSPWANLVYTSCQTKLMRGDESKLSKCNRPRQRKLRLELPNRLFLTKTVLISPKSISRYKDLQLQSL